MDKSRNLYLEEINSLEEAIASAIDIINFLRIIYFFDIIASSQDKIKFIN